MSGMRPHRTSSTESLASGATMRRSAPRAICSPPPRARPVHGGDHRDRELPPHPGRLLAEVGDAPVRRLIGPMPVARVAAPLGRRHGRRRRHGLEAGEVEPGAEGPALAREHDRPHRRIALQRPRRPRRRRRTWRRSRAFSLSGRLSRTSATPLVDRDGHGRTSGPPWSSRSTVPHDGQVRAMLRRGHAGGPASMAVSTAATVTSKASKSASHHVAPAARHPDTSSPGSPVTTMSNRR